MSLAPTPDDRVRRTVTRFPSTSRLEIVLRLDEEVVAEIKAVRDAGAALTLLPPEALAASSRYLAELILGPARPPDPRPAGDTPPMFGPESVLGPDPAAVAAEALEAERGRIAPSTVARWKADGRL